MESGKSKTELTTIFCADRIVHIYFSQQERMRFLRLFLAAQGKADHLIVAVQTDGLESLGAEFSQACRNSGALTTVKLLDGAHQNACRILAATLRYPRTAGTTKILADMSATTGMNDVLEIESLLTSGYRHLSVLCMTQYDGSRLKGAIPISRLRKHGLVIFRDFYCNQVNISAVRENGPAARPDRQKSDDALESLVFA